MKWFKHDSDAHTDAKLRRVRLKYGMQGYGLYWYCLELIARGVEKHRLTFELEHDAELIAADTGISRELVEEMMRFMASAGLFEDRGGIITCLKMASRTDEYTAKMLANRQSVPRVSGQTPDSVGTKSVLLEEIRLEEKKRVATASGSRHTDEGFAKFWEAYPRKVKKPDALRAWKQTAKERPPIDELLAHLIGRTWGDDPQFVPHPASFLRGHQWNDSPLIASPGAKRWAGAPTASAGAWR